MKKGAKFGLLGLLAGAAGMGSLAAAGNYFYELAMVPKRHDSAGDTTRLMKSIRAGYG